MIEVEEVVAFHEKLIEQYGGTPGIRSMELLESAIYRPYQTFDGNELYTTAIEKAGAVEESIVKKFIHFLMEAKGLDMSLCDYYLCKMGSIFSQQKRRNTRS